jgi:predicted N-acetyltransferase YhbS
VGGSDGLRTLGPVTSVRGRAYRGAADLRRMQDAVARAYAITALRAGDLAWLRRPYTHSDLMGRVRLWEDAGGLVVGWTFLRSSGGFNLFVAPGCASDGLLDEMVVGVVRTAGAAVEVGDPPVGLYTYGLDLDRSPEDRAVAAALERHGFVQVASSGGVMARSLETALPEAAVPPGYRLGWVETREHVLGRVEAHRAAFAPSEVTLAVYERVRASWPYRPVLDRIALTDGGEVVSFCTAWIDEANEAGLLEPVGTHPAHQRRGLARAVCADALRVLREAGARTAQVGYGNEAGHATYQSLGFEDTAADLVYRREVG